MKIVSPTCPKCGAPVEPEAKFCSQCAAPITRAADTEIKVVRDREVHYCPICHLSIKLDDSIFECPVCGRGYIHDTHRKEGSWAYEEKTVAISSCCEECFACELKRLGPKIDEIDRLRQDATRRAQDAASRARDDALRAQAEEKERQERKRLRETEERRLRGKTWGRYPGFERESCGRNTHLDSAFDAGC